MNLKTKAVLFILMGLLSAGMLFAGGGGQSQGSGQQINLSIWHIYTEQVRGAAIERAVRRFEAANPGVKIQVVVNANDPYKTKLKTISGEDFPDVFHSWGGGWLKSFVDVGYVEDISAEVKTAGGEVNQALADLGRFNGKAYAVPYNTGGTIFYYNRDIFAKYNLQPPKTFAELEKICQTLLANKITPFALANRSKWPGAQHFVLAAMRLGGPDIFEKANSGAVTFTDDVFIKAGQMVQDMVNKGWFPAGANGLDWDTGQSRMLMYQEQCAMIVQTSGLLAAIRSENPDFYSKKLGVTLYPAIEGGKGKATDILGGSNMFSVSANSKNKGMAKKLALFLATDNQMQQDFLDAGTVAAKPGLKGNDPLVNEILSQLANATFFQNYIDQTLSPELAEVHKDTCQALIGKTMTPAQAAETMQKAFDSAK